MEPADLEHIAHAVDSVLDDVEFEIPITLEDVLEVGRRIRENLPPAARLEIYHRLVAVFVEVRVDRQRVLRRERTARA